MADESTVLAMQDTRGFGRIQCRTEDLCAAADTIVVGYSLDKLAIRPAHGPGQHLAIFSH
jgi:hypothetical protein